MPGRLGVCVYGKSICLHVGKGRKESERGRKRENFLVVSGVRTNWLFWAGIQTLSQEVCVHEL